MSALLAYIRAHATEDRPLVPASWDVVIEADRWVTLYPAGREARPDVYFHCRLVVRDPSFATGATARAVFVCTGARAVLDRLADRIASDALPWTLTWTTLAALRAQAGVVATRLRNAWPDERPRDGQDPPQPIGTLVAHWRRMADFDAEDAES